MQSVSSRFWTRVAVSISYDDNHYTTGTSTKWKYKSTNKREYSKHQINRNTIFKKRVPQNKKTSRNLTLQ